MYEMKELKSQRNTQQKARRFQAYTYLVEIHCQQCVIIVRVAIFQEFFAFVHGLQSLRRSACCCLLTRLLPILPGIL